MASSYVAEHIDRLTMVLLHVCQSCAISGASWFENLCSLPHCTVSRKVSTILNLLQLEETRNNVCHFGMQYSDLASNIIRHFASKLTLTYFRLLTLLLQFVG